MESIALDSKDRTHWIVEPLIFHVAKISDLSRRNGVKTEALTEKDIINVPQCLRRLSSRFRLHYDYAETGHAPSTRMKRIDVEIPPIEDLIGFLEMNRR